MHRRLGHAWFLRSGYSERGCHHPHLHCVIPGGGLAPDHERWIACLPGFFLSVRVLSRLFRRLFLEALRQAFQNGDLQFFGDLQALHQPAAFRTYLAPLREAEWVVYSKPPFGGPQQAIEYLGRYTHRVAISNQRLLADQDGKVSFQWKDYRHQNKQNSKVTSVATEEFIRRFLMHTLPPGFQRIRHFGFLANCHRKAKLALCRQLLLHPIVDLLPQPDQCRQLQKAILEKPVVRCPHCGIGSMVRIAILPKYCWPATPPSDTS